MIILIPVDRRTVFLLIYLQTKKYMGECRFLFFTIAVMTRMFSSKEMIPRIRKTCGKKTSVSQNVRSNNKGTSRKKYNWVRIFFFS